MGIFQPAMLAYHRVPLGDRPHSPFQMLGKQQLRLFFLDGMDLWNPPKMEVGDMNPPNFTIKIMGKSLKLGGGFKY